MMDDFEKVIGKKIVNVQYDEDYPCIEITLDDGMVFRIGDYESYKVWWKIEKKEGEEMSKNVKRVALLKHKDGEYLYDSWRGNAYTSDDILNAKQFANAAAAKGVRTRLKNGDEFSIVFVNVTIEEVAK